MHHSHAVDIANSFHYLLENLHCPANIHKMVWTLKQIISPSFTEICKIMVVFWLNYVYYAVE